MVPTSASGVPTSISACTMPASSSAATASAAQRDQIGRIAPSSRSSAWRSRNTDQHDQPAQPDRHAGQVHRVDDHRDGGHRRRGRVPGQRPGGAAPPRRGRQQHPVGRARASPTSGAQQERGRRQHAEPHQLRGAELAAQHVAQVRAGDVEQPAAGRVRRLQQQLGRVLAATRPSPVHTSRAGPRGDSRCGHSSASTSTGPTSRTSPAYPRYLTIGIAAVDDRVDLVSLGQASVGVADGAPTE